jgi:hypothetical protein
MAHYAFLDESNIVTEVIVGIDETQLIEGKDPEIWYGEFRGQKCIRTSYNGKIRYNYAGIGFTYDPIDDAFIAPQPYPSWTLDQNKQWQSPIPYPGNPQNPTNTERFIWDEENQEWIANG